MSTKVAPASEPEPSTIAALRIKSSVDRMENRWTLRWRLVLRELSLVLGICLIYLIIWSFCYDKVIYHEKGLLYHVGDGVEITATGCDITFSTAS